MDTTVLKGLICSTYEDFDMHSFENRLKLQKFFYIMQHMFKLNVGYEFGWYMYGPYCTELAKDAFMVEDFSKIKINFQVKEEEELFKNFINFIQPHRDDILWLEVVSSIDLLRKINPLDNKEKIVKEVMDKREQLKDKKEYIESIWEELHRGGFIK